jgi:hypothetical protein
MNPILQFSLLTGATLFAAAAAVAFDWLLLLGAFRLMKPATARRPAAPRSRLVSGTVRLAQAYGPQK